MLEKTTWDIGVPFASRLAAAGPLLVRYVGNTLWPFDLEVFYDVPLRTSWGDPVVLGAWAILLGSAAIWLRLLRRGAVVAFGIAWYFTALFPVSGVVDLLQPALMADRYLYVPLAGAALAVAGTIAAAGEAARRLPLVRSRVLACIGGAVVIACCMVLAVATAQRLPVWRGPVSLWEEARRGAPASPYVLNALGMAYWKSDRLDAAEQALVQAASLAPDYTAPKLNLGIVAFFRGDLDTATSFTDQVLQLDPRDSAALRQKGMIFDARGLSDLSHCLSEGFDCGQPLTTGAAAAISLSC